MSDGWWAAAGWGLVAGGALVLGAAVAWFVRIPPRLIASVMAFGSGVLISALAFDLAADAAERGGLAVMSAGFLAGAGAYVVANIALARRGARHRKRSGTQQAAQSGGSSGMAIAIGSLLDGIPESVVLGASLLGGHGVSVAVAVAIAISNLPEGLSSAAGMKAAGRTARYVFGLWSAIALATTLAATAGYLVLGGAAPQTVAVITAVAAGAILTMVADTMIPEAFERTHLFTGLITAAGFLVAFALSQAA